MNYYERHLGDYAKDTAHLSLLEHGVFTLLLDRYYASEHAIAADQVYRIARARNKEEKLAVDAVLAEFFHLQEGVYCNSRADAEIERARQRIRVAQENGRRGGRPRKSSVQSKGLTAGSLAGSDQAKPQPSQTEAFQSPDTSHQIPLPPSLSPLASQASEEMRQCASEMAASLRQLGVSISSANPLLQNWIKQGISSEETREAVALARHNKPLPQSIPAAYLDKVIHTQREQQRSSGKAGNPGNPQSRQRAAVAAALFPTHMENDHVRTLDLPCRHL